MALLWKLVEDGLLQKPSMSELFSIWTKWLLLRASVAAGGQQANPHPPQWSGGCLPGHAPLQCAHDRQVGGLSSCSVVVVKLLVTHRAKGLRPFLKGRLPEDTMHACSPRGGSPFVDAWPAAFVDAWPAARLCSGPAACAALTLLKVPSWGSQIGLDHAPFLPACCRVRCPMGRLPHCDAAP